MVQQQTEMTGRRYKHGAALSIHPVPYVKIIFARHRHISAAAVGKIGEHCKLLDGYYMAADI